MDEDSLSCELPIPGTSGRLVGLNLETTDESGSASELFPQMKAQVEALTTILQEIQDKSIGNDEIIATALKNHTELERHPKATLAKSQMAIYEKEIIKTDQEMVRIRKALDLVIELQSSMFAAYNVKDDHDKDIEKGGIQDLVQDYADCLPLWIGEEGKRVPPLCGCIRVDDGYISKPDDMVAAHVLVKGKMKEEWILSKVIDYNAEKQEYKVQDIDEKVITVYTVIKDKIIPLATMRAHPEDNPEAIFKKGNLVLALYPSTTCFYKAIVHQPPKSPEDPYSVCFADSDCDNGYSPPDNVPQRYVLGYVNYGDSDDEENSEQYKQNVKVNRKRRAEEYVGYSYDYDSSSSSNDSTDHESDFD